MKFLIPDVTGHTVVEFDKANPDDMERALDMFMKLVKEERKVAYARGGKGSKSSPRVTSEMDPNADETVFFSPLQGG